MSGEEVREPVRLALDVADAALADRLAALLADVPGLLLVAPGEPADAAVVMPAEPPEPAADVPLTPRELEVLALLAEGASNKTIARRLGISVHTAKFHVGSLIDKLDAVGPHRRRRPRRPARRHPAVRAGWRGRASTCANTRRARPGISLQRRRAAHGGKQGTSGQLFRGREAPLVPLS